MKHRHKRSWWRQDPSVKPISKAEFAGWVLGYVAAVGWAGYHVASAINPTVANSNVDLAQVASASDSRDYDDEQVRDRPVRKLEQIEAPAVRRAERGLEKSVVTVPSVPSEYNLPGLKRISIPHLHDNEIRPIVIMLDPGHGMANAGSEYDPGAVARDANGRVLKNSLGSVICEANIVLGQADRIRKLLESRGYEIYQTREDETTSTPVRGRVPKANEKKADIMVSLHLNGSNLLEARGEEVYYQNEKGSPENGKRSRTLARKIERLIYDYVNQNPKFQAISREIRPKTNVKGDRLEVLTGKRPSVLVESGFVTNVVGDKADIDYLAFDRMKYVELAIADAIDAYIQGEIVPQLYAEQQAKERARQTRQAVKPKPVYKSPQPAPATMAPSQTRQAARAQSLPQFRPTDYQSPTPALRKITDANYAMGRR